MMSTKHMAKIMIVMLAICFLTKTDGKLAGVRTVTLDDLLACVNGFVTNEERHIWLTNYLEQMKVLSAGRPGPHFHGPYPENERNLLSNHSQGSIERYEENESNSPVNHSPESIG